ncbi:MAG: DUF5320 domain-containing protein [Syntrophobacteraceae bacterium]|nr:DUF5320 domain-containing protein [Syntrophobacteraceae bacterium]
MPGFDRSGPNGAGPMTGGVRGSCGGLGGRGVRNRSEGGGVLTGRGGGGRGCKNRFFSTAASGLGFSRGPQTFEQGFGGDVESVTHLETLKKRAGYFEKILDGIKRQIQRLESGTPAGR